MEVSSSEAHEIRAARSQSLFRAVNEKLSALNETFESVTETFVIACECADPSCVAMLTVKPEEYYAVRCEPRRFAVLAAHVFPDVERVVGESDSYVVVEKINEAAKVAESTA